MSWKSGSSIFADIVTALKEHIEDDDLRELVYFDLIHVFESHDCDTLYECLGEDAAFDEAYYELNPDTGESEEE